MNIALSTIYGSVYRQDRIFDSKSCKIGENLLEPGVQLKKHLEKLGHQFHTLDMYKNQEVDSIIFQDIDPNCYFCQRTVIGVAKYILKTKWRNDDYLQVKNKTGIDQRILILLEPPVANVQSYNTSYHKHFGKILTWNDDLVDNRRYYKLSYPQVVPPKLYRIPYSNKKELVMICGNKKSKEENELYSARRSVIDYFEKTNKNFDLYGFGWEKEKLKNYKGTTEKKLSTLSQYRFSICYENMTGVKGYITEKIFDCFFAGSVPVYWGADNVTDYIPEDAFIDRRKFSTLDELMDYLANLTEKEYQNYLDRAEDYIYSKQFSEEFSVQKYIERVCGLLFGE